MYLYLALLDKFGCLIVYRNFIVCLRVSPSRSLLWSSTIQLGKWLKTPSNTPDSSIAYYHRNVLKQPMNARQAKALNLYLQKEEYVQGTVDWLVKDAEAWDSLCEHWASPAFIAKSERA
jgi:hypothetical protein